MAVSFFTDNKFGFSRFTRKKNVFIRSVFLTLVKNYSQRTALFYVLTILPLLVLGVVTEGNQVLCLEVEALHHLLLIIVIRGVVIVFRELVCFRNTDEDPPFLSSSCGTSLSQFTVNSTPDSRFTDNYYKKSRFWATTKITFHEEYNKQLTVHENTL